MRTLSKRQKKLLDEWYKKHGKDLTIFVEIDKIDEFDIFDELVRINDHETIVQNINRYLSDKVSKNMYGR